VHYSVYFKLIIESSEFTACATCSYLERHSAKQNSKNENFVIVRYNESHPQAFTLISDDWMI